MSFNNFSFGWKIEKIKNICKKVTSGGTPSRKNEDFYNNGSIYWVKTKELNDNHIYITEEKITDEALERSSAKLLPENTVLIAMYGATVSQLGILKVKAATNQACCAMIVNESKVNYLYLFYILKHNRNKIINLSNGAAQQNINVGIIKNFEVPIPPLKEQKAIVNILATLDNKIEINKKTNKTLEKIAQAIYKSWFIDFEPFQDSNFVESELGMIPEGWEVKTLVETCSIIDCLHSKKPEDLQEGNNILLQVYNVGENCRLDLSDKYLIDDNDYSEWTRRIEVSEGDIIITKTGRVGAVAQIPKGFKAAIGRNLVAIRPNVISKELLRGFVNSSYMEKEVLRNTIDGTILKSLHVKNIKKVRVIVPPKKILEKFSKLTKDIYEMINSNMEQNRNLSQLRDTLLPKLMSGELRVPIEDIEMEVE